MDYACPTWRFAAHTYVRKLQVLQSLPCHRCPLYISGRQIHEDVGVPLFVDHIRALIASLDSKLADMRNLLVRQLGVNLRWPMVDPRHLTWKPRAAGISRPVEITPGWPSRLNKSYLALSNRTPFRYSDWCISVIFPQL